MLAICAVGLLTFAVHRPVLSAQAISFDDNLYLFENPLIQRPGWDSIRRFFREVFESSTIEGYYEPLTLLSLMVDVELGGRADHLQQFHRTSLALHVLNTMLIIVLLYQLFGHPRAAALAGILFGLHPLTVEPVAWVWERKTLLAAFFVLWSLIGYVFYTHRKTRASYAMSLAAFFLSLLAKPTGTPLPILLILLDYWPLRRLNRHALYEKIPFFFLSGLSAVVTIISTQRNAVLTLPGQQLWVGMPFQVSYLLMFYLAKIIYPANLSSVYSPPGSHLVVIACLILTLLLAAALVASVRWMRAPLTGALFFVAALFPMLGLLRYSWVIASDKYVYLPAIGLLLIVTNGLSILLTSHGTFPAHNATFRGGVIALIVLGLAVGEAVATRRYLRAWTDTETLYRHMIRVSPTSPASHNNLSAVLLMRSQVEEAIREARESIRLDPRHTGAYVSLGNGLMRQERIAEAAEAFRFAVNIDPHYARAHHNLGLALYRLGQYDDSVSELSRAIELQPDYAEGFQNYGAALLKVGRFEAARDSFQQAVRRQPKMADGWSGLGNADVRLGRFAEALADYERAAHIDPTRGEDRRQLAALLFQAGRPDEAVRELRDAARVCPEAVPLLNDLAWTLATQRDARLRDGAEAVRVAEKACSLTSYREARVLDTLAAAYAESGAFDQAAATARLALEQANPKDAKLSEAIRTRLALYESRKPYRE